MATWGKGVAIRERGPGWSYRPDERAPSIYGPHQPGVVTPQAAHLAIGAFDLGGDLEAVLREWSTEAERLMRAGEATVTLGLGAGVFRGRLREGRPLALRELPAFAADALDPALCGGDLCVLAGTETQAAAEAALARFGTPRWRHLGHRGDPLGFRDGTLNLRRGRDMDRHVWVTRRERSWMVGGTFLVVRRIVIEPTWHALPLAEQERAIGRHKDGGAPLGHRRLYDAPHLDRLPPKAHIRVAAPRSNGGAALLRRGYATDDGLLFLAYQRDPRRQFVPIQRNLDAHDALTAHARHVGSAVFAIPPGARPGGFVGGDVLR